MRTAYCKPFFDNTIPGILCLRPAARVAQAQPSVQHTIRWQGHRQPKRAENVVHQMVTQNGGAAAWTELPLGIAAPLREAARTCQLAPPGNWPLDAYRLIGRNDLATSATVNPDAFISKGYKPRKEYIVSIPISYRQISFSKFLLRIPQSLSKQSERLPRNRGGWQMKQRRRVAWILI